MEGREIFMAAASLAALLLLVLCGTIIAVAVLAIGSPLALIGAIGAMGVFGLIVLAGLLGAFVSAWYVAYALMKGFLSPPDEPPKKGNYAISRVRKS